MSCVNETETVISYHISRIRDNMTYQFRSHILPKSILDIIYKIYIYLYKKFTNRIKL